MTLDIHQILKLLPHRYPFLLVDRVLEMEKGKSIKALKNVTMNAPFFNGHFPHRPVMPGVLMLEAMAQAAALLSFHSLDIVPDEDNPYAMLAAIDEMGEQVAKVRVDAGFKLSPASALAWVENDFRAPR